MQGLKAAKEPVERTAERVEAAAKVLVEAGWCVAAALLEAEEAWFRVRPERGGSVTDVSKVNVYFLRLFPSCPRHIFLP